MRQDGPCKFGWLIYPKDPMSTDAEKGIQEAVEGFGAKVMYVSKSRARTNPNGLSYLYAEWLDFNQISELKRNPQVSMQHGQWFYKQDTSY
jgi:hypothetical protein